VTYLYTFPLPSRNVLFKIRYKPSWYEPLVVDYFIIGCCLTTPCDNKDD